MHNNIEPLETLRYIKQLPEPPGVEFWIYPYIPKRTTTLLYGKTHVGKSPVTFYMAAAIGTGTPFFGCITQQGRVLYVEMDTDASIVRPRLWNLPMDVATPGLENVYFCWLYGGLHITAKTPVDRYQALLRAQRDVRPDAVIINTLRKAYRGKDVDSESANLIYTAYRDIFMDAALLFVHHEPKENKEYPRDDEDAASGSKAWLNDAQQAIRLTSKGIDAERNAYAIQLSHVKGAGAEKAHPMMLYLSKSDGVTMAQGEITDTAKRTAVVEAWARSEGLGLSKTKRVEWAAEDSGASVRFVWGVVGELTARDPQDPPQ